MLDEYEKINSKHTPGMITGKPIELSGSRGRGSATAQGGAYVLREYGKLKEMKPEETSIVIQGFGNAGSFMAKILYDWGYKIIAVSDSKGGIYNPDGLKITELIEHKTKNKKVAGFKDCKEITNKELLELECDVLVPAALENQITDKNADKIKAQLVLELANGPTTPEADKILEKNKVVLIPDVLANAGGVTVSYFEWVQNLYGYYWSEEEVLNRLEKIMKNAFIQVYETSNKYKTHMRNGAYIFAINRILTADRLRGNI
jgi:glutamate dehydrogenase/leucine dehydrogenase